MGSWILKLYMYMPTYLELLPDDVLNMIYRYVNDRAVANTIKRAKRKMLPCHGHRTNCKVIWSWMNDKPWYSLSMRTDGKSIYSYHLEIGKTEDGEKVCLPPKSRALPNVPKKKAAADPFPHTVPVRRKSKRKKK